MTNIPSKLFYTKSHEWLQVEENNTAIVGITEYATTNLGDIVFVEQPSTGETLDMNAEAGVVESVKAATDVYSPIAGEVIEINSELHDSPGIVNDDPFGKGWFFRIKITDESQLKKLMNATEYAKAVANE